MRIITIPFACAARKSGRSGVYYSVLAGLPAIRKNQKSRLQGTDQNGAKLSDASDHNSNAFDLTFSQQFSLWHIRTAEIEIAIATGVEFLAFSSISVPIPIWIPIAAAII